MNKKLSPANLVIVIAGAVMVVGSFLAFYKFSYFGTQTYNAWSRSNFAIVTLVVLLGLVMAGQIALATFGGLHFPDRVLGLTWDQIHVALGFQAALMMLAFLIRDTPGASKGAGFWLLFIGAAALLTGAILRTRETQAPAS